MRQLLSTALVAAIVGALAGVTAGAFAQPGPGSAVEPAARAPNADRVDGRHAVGYTNRRGVRAGKLVATNARGLLPPNIVQPYWGYIKNKPGILADHQIHWNEVVGKPAIAGGSVAWADVTGKPAILDDRQVSWGEVRNKPAGSDLPIKGYYVKKFTLTLGPGALSTEQRHDCNDANDLAISGGWNVYPESAWVVRTYRGEAANRWIFQLQNLWGSVTEVELYVHCLER